MPSIFNMFGKSPIKPLQEHMSKVADCAEALIPFFKAVIAGDWATAKKTQKEIAKLENDADDIKRIVRMNLPKGLFMPVARADVLGLVSLQDSIANRAKDIAGVVYGRRMNFPQEVSSEFEAFLQVCVNATLQAKKAINELDELQETGFSGQEIKIIEKMIKELAQIEHKTDKLQIDIRKHMFANEKTWPPIDVIFMYKIVEWTGELADKAQNVGDRLQLLLVR